MTNKLTPAAKYVSLIYDDTTQNKLRHWAEDNGFDLTKTYNGLNQNPGKFVFHTTILYTSTVHQMANIRIIKKPKIHVEPLRFEMFGNDENIPVLIVKSSGLTLIKKHFESTYGMKDTRETYTPHISLSYAKNKVNLDVIDLPDFDMYGDVVEVTNAE